MSTFYNRDRNISGISPISSLTYDPVYGSRVSFSSMSNTYFTRDGYFNSIPLSPNSLSAEYELRYDLNELDSQKLIDFIESKNGEDFIEFTDSSNFYKTLSGFSDSYAVNHINKGHYEVAIKMTIDRAPTLLNWSGMTFINTTFQNWTTRKVYEKYDIVYSAVNSNKLNNYYYCIENHTSSSTSVDGPTGSSSKWTQNFFFEPDLGLQNNVDLKVDKINFKNSFPQRIKTEKNIAKTDFNYKFSNITTKKAKAIMHFLENKGGYRRFLHYAPSIYNRPKVFYSPSWNHTWKYYNSHDIEVNFIEDPLGVIPTGS
ncbi:MAG: hypothetical protein RLZZ196_581 [Bacteroidota bacterium]|jgi:phage-related protein